MNGTFLSPLLADGLAWFEAPDPVILFALTLVFAGLAGEFVFRWLRLPRITGYALIGILMGTSGLAEANPLDSAAQNIVTDIALGILLIAIHKPSIREKYKHPLWLQIIGWLVAGVLSYMSVVTLRQLF